MRDGASLDKKSVSSEIMNIKNIALLITHSIIGHYPSHTEAEMAVIDPQERDFEVLFIPGTFLVSPETLFPICGCSRYLMPRLRMSHLLKVFFSVQ
jgi:hypothetical protein